MKEITVRTIVAEYLRSHGCDGLLSIRCACRLDNLMPCSDEQCPNEDMADCEPGYIRAMDAEGYEGIDWAMVPYKRKVDETDYGAAGWRQNKNTPKPNKTVLVAVWDGWEGDTFLCLAEWISDSGWLLHRSYASGTPDPYEEVRYWMYLPDVPSDAEDGPHHWTDALWTGPELA